MNASIYSGWTSRLVRSRPALSRWVLPAAILFFLAWSVVSVRSNFSWDDAEPEILNQAWRMAKGESIYHGIETPPFAFAVYPPVYYALVALMTKLTGLSFLPGKLISFLAALSIGWALAHLNREWNKSGWGGVWAAFFLFLIPAFLYNATRNHVQMLAVALSLWSLVFFLRARWQESVVLSPLLAVLAIYTKQSQIALPLAMLIYLSIRDRRRLIPYAATLAIAVLIPFAWLQIATEGYFFSDTFRLAKLSYNALQIPLILLHHAGPILIFVGLASLTLWKRLRSGSWDAVDCYFGCVVAITLFTLGRIGAHGQYVIELLVVTMVYLLRTAGLPEIRGRDALVSIQILLLFCYTPMFIIFEEGLWDMSANRAAATIYPLLKDQEGPILSQQGSFALFGRGEIRIQLFDFANLARLGLWNQDLLLKDINGRAFPFVITESDIKNPVTSENERERFTPEMLKALRENYRIMREEYPYYVYIPRPR